MLWNLTAMITPGLARNLATLGRLGEDTSTESVLRGLTTALAAGVPGCSGGSAEHWRDHRVLVVGLAQRAHHARRKRA